jgi:hypothetical protein
VIHKLFDEHTFEVTPDTLEKAFEGIDYTKKVSSTEPVIDVYDEKVPLMTRIAALFKKTP